MANEKYEAEKSTLVNKLLVQAIDEGEERKVLEFVRNLESNVGRGGKHEAVLESLRKVTFKEIMEEKKDA